MRTPAQKSSAVFTILMIFYLLVVIAAEIIAIVAGLLATAVIDGLLVIGLANYSYFTRLPTVRRFIPSLALVPLLRILSIAIPIPQAAPLVWYMLVGLPLLVSSLLIIRFYGLPALRTDLSLRKWLFQVLFGFSGIMFGILTLRLLPAPKAVILHQTIGWYLLGVIILTIFSGFTEEIIFRGLIQDAFSYAFGIVGIFASSILYAGLFIGTLQPATIIFFGLTGLIFAVWVKYSNSLLGVIIAHSLLNIIFLLINHAH